MREIESENRRRAIAGAFAITAVAIAAALLVGHAPGVANETSAPVPVVLPAPGRCVEAQYEGHLDLEGHYARPGDTRRYRSRQRFLADAAGAVRLDWTTWSEGDSAGPPESWLLRDGRVLKRGAPGEPWREIAGDRAPVERLQTLAGLPWTLACVPGLKVQRGGERIESIEDLRAHPRLGDVHNTIRYRYDSIAAPSGFDMVLYERDHNWTLTAERTSFTTDADAETLLAAPATFEPAPPDAGELVGDPVIVQFADGVWSLDCEDVDSRTLVVEFADHLALIEVAVGSAHGERLVDAVQRRWPEKAIRWVLFSHHHPHYTGGLRALIAAGATVVTTAGNKDYVQRVARYPFRLEPDRLARAPRSLRLRTFTDRFELKDETNTLIAIDIGERSTHTDEFAIFWLPRQRLVFETEQGWVTTNGELRASRRAAGFLKTLADEGVNADRMVQSWPMRGNRAEVSRTELEALVAARAK
jgi:hypothetical protein